MEYSKLEKSIPWVIILAVCLLIIFGTGIVLKKVVADTDIRSVTVGNDPPTVGTVTLNSGSDITLTENATATIQATTIVTDTDTYSDISSIEGKIYRSGVGTSCSDDDNNCYSDSSCATSNCSGNSCTATCEADVWFHAEPTDTGSPWESQYWEAWIKAIDSDNASSSATSSGVEVNTLRALDLSTSSIDYGTINPGDDTGTLSETTTVTDTGNAAIDIYLYGTNMESGANNIPVGNQEWSASTSLNYASGTDLTSSTSTQAELDISKPTTHSPNTSTDDIYWGLGVSIPTAAGAYSGTTTFEAKVENWWYIPSGSWSWSTTTIVRDISHLSDSDDTVSKDIYCDDNNCVLWDGAATPTSFCIATNPDVYGNILWSKTDSSSSTWADSGFSISGGDIGGTHDASLECGDENEAIGAKNWLARNYTSAAGTFDAMDACKDKGFGWRLPNLLELDSIRDQAKGSRPYSRLPNIAANVYWSSSENSTSIAYLLYFYSGIVSLGDKSYNTYVRCVRGQ